MSEFALQIGEIANRSGVSVDTVRYYEKRKLILGVSRSQSGYRLFQSETVEQILFIKQAQELGFSLEEIKELLTPGGAEECSRVRDLLKTKLTDLDEKMSKINKFRGVLAIHLVHCEAELQAKGRNASCPVLVEIGHHNESES